MTNESQWIGRAVRIIDHTLKSGRETFGGLRGVVVGRMSGGQYSVKLQDGRMISRPVGRMVRLEDFDAPPQLPIATQHSPELYIPPVHHVRPGADDYLLHPSRRGSLRIWRDGRQEQVQ
ncbi:hypothetical protein [Pulveribacter sp.]|uniref:hypothetical protein n=1 Tax=Pulveribacter sp. TaxID=2678893 RepID=UPI00289A7626|nr:hypothetical protein [Pulveribacter sp.]